MQLETEQPLLSVTWDGRVASVVDITKIFHSICQFKSHFFKRRRKQKSEREEFFHTLKNCRPGMHIIDRRSTEYFS